MVINVERTVKATVGMATAATITYSISLSERSPRRCVLAGKIGP
jgi:hypothetical protein